MPQRSRTQCKHKRGTLHSWVFPCTVQSPNKNFDAQRYREFVRTLSDEALIKEGKQMPWLSGDGKIVSTMPSAFDEQLKIYSVIENTLKNFYLPESRSLPKKVIRRSLR